MKASEFAETPLGSSLATMYGFGPKEFAMLEGFAQRQRRAADQARNQTPRGRGKAATAIRTALLEQFGCPEDQLSRLEFSDRHDTMLPREAGVEKKWTDIIFAANCMSLAPGCANESVE